MKVKKQKRNLIISLISLLFSVIILTTVIFGWFTITQNNEINSFNIEVVDKNHNVLYSINADTIDQSGYYFEYVYPGKEYNFEITMQNLSEIETANYSIFFQGFSDNLEENGVNLDMEGIFQVQKQGESAQYFRELLANNKVTVETGTLAVLETKTVSFKMIFAEYYMYADETTTNQEDIINLFQNKEFMIDVLIIEII